MVAKRAAGRGATASGGVVIPLALPLIADKEAEAARAAVLSGWVSQGPEVAAFEREFAALVGASHACAVSSCTGALHIALKALDIGPGDEVIVPTHSFIATANCVRFCGAKPVFVDIAPEGHNIDPERAADAITPRTRAILAVHQMGMPCDLAALAALARRHGVALVEDAACAAGSQIRLDDAWEAIGRPHGDVACFSFHNRCVITTGEGGMLTTRDPALDEKFRLLRAHGRSEPDPSRSGGRVILDDYLMVGFNYRMTDIQAAIGRSQLARLPDIVARRRRLAARYQALLGAVEDLGLPSEPQWARSNWRSYCVRLPDAADQRGVMQALLDRGVATQRGVMCAHREPPYANGAVHADLRLSERAQDRTILLPLYAQMSDGDQECVANALREAVRI